MSRTGNNSILALLVIGGAALALNPDDDSFRRYVANDLRSTGSSWIEQQLISRASSLVYKRIISCAMNGLNATRGRTRLQVLQCRAGARVGLDVRRRFRRVVSRARSAPLTDSTHTPEWQQYI